MAAHNHNSYPMKPIGGSAFNHSSSSSAEAGNRSSCFDKAHQAYERGDGAGAHNLSEEGKQHAAKMNQYNKQASEYIFRENNAPGRVAEDTIDLHGLFVKEAGDILEQRIRYAQQHGQTHLHVIVGKGNHSVNHVQKIKPRVEQICNELHLKHSVEPNEGRIYINLTGAPAVMPAYGPYQPNPLGGGQQQGAYPLQPQGGYPAQQQGAWNGKPQQGQNNEDEMEKLAKKLVPKLRRLDGCCVVM